MNKRIISYSLYNGRPKDVLNGVINCLLSIRLYPGWICRFHIDETVPKEIVEVLRTFKHVEVIEMPKQNGPEGMLWRFHPASDPDVLIMISRDCDSWISSREVACVKTWAKSEKGFHIIRDHCYHSQKIMGGMWGIKRGALPQMKELCEEFARNESYDQKFLADMVYPSIIGNSMIHLGNQFDRNGNKANGYHGDGGIPIPVYRENDAPVPHFSFREVNQLNAFRCLHCRKVHLVFVGGIMEKIPRRSLIKLREYFTHYGIGTSMIDSLL